MIAYYGSELSENITETPEGFLICKNVPIARTGNMEYWARDLPIGGNPNKKITVTRDEKEVFDPAALASFEGKSVTDDHPPDDITPENYRMYEKGHVENVRRGDGKLSEYILADLHIRDRVLYNSIKSGKREISCGYCCEYSQNKDGTFAQRQIRGNHVAVVKNGRAGSSVSIKDSALKEKTERGKNMKKTKTQGLLSMFGRAVHDAAPEDIDEMAADASSILEPETKTTGDASVTPSATASNSEENIGAKLDHLISMIESMAKVGEKALYETPEAKIDSIIKELDKEKNTCKTDNAVTIPAKENQTKTKDSVISMLKNVRPAIAAIKDQCERKRVTDALLSTFNEGENTMSAIMSAVDKSAGKSARDCAPELDLSKQQAAYDIRNPHKMKGAE